SVVNTWSAWDDAHEMIYTYATVRVQRYFGEATGPDTLVVREVGGTVDGYTMEAVGFPMVRSNEEVVLFLAPWDDGGAELRIHAFNQGKFLVRNRGGKEFAVADPVHQGEAREGRSRIEVNSLDDDSPALSIDELAGMIEAARAGVSRTTDFQTDRQ
ncbi:MAG TPA: hypothetical protein VJZ00_11540, partial [Thermoanaerobaculia bacterium]|nr:hypothetical protein [Thermoanaerobaculia bacterium]